MSCSESSSCDQQCPIQGTHIQFTYIPCTQLRHTVPGYKWGLGLYEFEIRLTFDKHVRFGGGVGQPRRLPVGCGRSAFIGRLVVGQEVIEKATCIGQLASYCACLCVMPSWIFHELACCTEFDALLGHVYSQHMALLFLV